MASSYRIVMLAPFGIRPKGTLSARMLPLAQALTRRGHRVQIVAPPVHNPQDAGQRSEYDGVTVMHTRRPTLPGPAGFAQQVLALLRSVLVERPDVIHLFKPKGYSGLSALLAQALQPDIPLVVDTDDWEGWGGWNNLLPYPRIAKALFHWQERDLPRRAAAVTVASRTLETQVWGFNVDPARVFYLPNGIERAPLHPPATAQQTNQLCLLLYTRFWEFDVRDVVTAMVAIVAHHANVRLLVIGRGERGEENELFRLARRAGVADVIDYRGWVEPEHIPALLASADIALVPLNDTLINRARCSAKLLELMAIGLPIVAGNVGQVNEYINHGESGLLVTPGDPAALALAALRLLADPDLRIRMSAGTRASLASYRWDRLAPIVEQAYCLALASR